MLVVGLTGGIASGKSEVAAAFARLGVPVTDADTISHELVASGEPGYVQLVATLGREVLDSSGRLDRARLRKQLFNDAGLRKTIEAILHPLILDRMQADLDGFDAVYAIAAVPLLAENAGARALVDRILVVDCPVTLQIQRLMARDGETAESAGDILAAQTDREHRRTMGDDILFNTGSLAELARTVTRLHGLYLDIAPSTPPHRPVDALAAAQPNGKSF